MIFFMQQNPQIIGNKDIQPPLPAIPSLFIFHYNMRISHLAYPMPQAGLGNSVNQVRFSNSSNCSIGTGLPNK
jgi:hypothetical protein